MNYPHNNRLRQQQHQSTPKTTTTTTTTITPQDNIVDKLHGVLAKLRRERDTVHRRKELATERLRLATEERQAMDKTVHSMQEKLDQLHKAATKERKGDIANLQQEVERLGREVQFQHSDLVGKRDKISNLRNQTNQQAKSREASILTAGDTVRKRRNKVASSSVIATLTSTTGNNTGNGADWEAPSMTMTPQKQQQQLKKLLEQENSLLEGDQGRLDYTTSMATNMTMWSKWPRVIQQKANTFTTKADDLHRTCESIRRRIVGYKKHLGEEKQVQTSSMNDPNNMEIETAMDEHPTQPRQAQGESMIIASTIQ